MSTLLILHMYGYDPLVLCYFLYFYWQPIMGSAKMENRFEGSKSQIDEVRRPKSKNLGAFIQLSIDD